MRRVLLACGFASFCCWPVSGVAAAEESADWPTFRGPQRTGVSTDTGLLQKWPAEGPPLVWETKGAGLGYATVAILGDRLYTLGDAPSTADDDDEYLTCFDLADGKQLWKLKTGPAWTSGQPDWQSARSTPSTDGKLVYVVTPHGELVCADASSGKEIWRKSFKQEFEGKKGDGWGYSESVLLDGEKLVCTPGGSKNTVVALNKETGDVLWKCSREGDRGAGHASVVISEVGGTKVYVQTTASGALGVRANDGKLLWSYPIDRTTAVIPMPIVRDDLVFFTAGYKRGGALLRQKPNAEGGMDVEEIYPLKISLANKHGGVVLVGEYLYGDSDSSGTPFCADLMTGEQKWKQRGHGGNSASVCAADGCLYILYSGGVMTLVKATPEAYEELGKFKVPGSGDRPSWAHPVVAGGKLYLREQDAILCYDVKAK